MQRAFDFLRPGLGEMPAYDKHPDRDVFVVGEGGQNILAITKPARVYVPHWPLVAKAQIRRSMTNPSVSNTGAALCYSIARSIKTRVQAVIEAVKVECPEGGHTLVIPVLQAPVVYFGDAEEGPELELVVEIVIGMVAMPVADEVEYKRFDRFPLERATEETFLVPIENDWSTYEGQQVYAEQLRKAARAGLMGLS